MSHILFKPLEDQVILWFEATNRYVVVQKEVSHIIQGFYNDISEYKIALKLSVDLKVPIDVATSFVSDIKTDLYYPNHKKEIVKVQNALLSGTFATGKNCISKFYSFNDSTFQVDYQSSHELRLIHFKFAHLEIEPLNTVCSHFKVFTHQELICLMVNNELIGAWDERNVHFFQGKFSMQIIQQLYQKEEREWMGVFHASAVRKGESCVLVLGDSGNGKSTSLALLQAHGYDCLADDFVPIDAQNNTIYTFPAAISIKRNSIETLLPYYPELKGLNELELKKQNKIVKYLPTKPLNYLVHPPCRALIFIEYCLGETCNLTRISNIEAFQKIVTDSWLSPLKQNVENFLNWFEGRPCYKLTYSDNSKMIATFETLFTDDL